MAAACVVLLVGCGMDSPSPAPPCATASGGPSDPVVVTLGIYSGRPDPTWTLTGAEAATLNKMLAGLADVTDTPPIGGLGYHGFTVTRPGSTLVAFDGAIAPPGEGPRAMKSDPGRSVERYLLETSRPHVTPNEFATTKLALGEP